MKTNMQKLFKPITYSIQNGEEIIEGYTLEKPKAYGSAEKRINGIANTIYQKHIDEWKQSKVAVKVDKEFDKLIKSYYKTLPFNIDFLADRIYLHEVGIDSVFTTTAFILPEKKDIQDYCPTCGSHVEIKGNTTKYFQPKYSIEQIEKAIVEYFKDPILDRGSAVEEITNILKNPS